jgi:tetratricopeptide (TPR) repeat protein
LDQQAARDILVEIGQRTPREASNWRRLALLEQKLGNDDQALEYARRAVELSPHYLEGWSTLGKVAEAAGEEEQAEAAWAELDRLYDSPVREHAAIQDLIEPVYIYAWDYLAERAEERDAEEEVLRYRRKMAQLLVRYYEFDVLHRLLMRETGRITPSEEVELDSLAEKTALDLETLGGAEEERLAREIREAREVAQQRMQEAGVR